MFSKFFRFYTLSHTCPKKNFYRRKVFIPTAYREVALCGYPFLLLGIPHGLALFDLQKDGPAWQAFSWEN